jgi:hypothetical protein
MESVNTVANDTKWDTPFSVAGVSKWNNSFKVRFANDLARVKMLVKRGNTDIELIELPTPMTKPEIITYLKTTDLYKNPEYAAAIDEADEKYNPVPRVPKKRGRKPKSAAVVTLDAIKARAAVMSTSDSNVEVA